MASALCLWQLLYLVALMLPGTALLVSLIDSAHSEVRSHVLSCMHVHVLDAFRAVKGTDRDRRPQEEQSEPRQHTRRNTNTSHKAIPSIWSICILVVELTYLLRNLEVKPNSLDTCPVYKQLRLNSETTKKELNEGTICTATIQESPTSLGSERLSNKEEVPTLIVG